jgi:Sortase domain
MPPAARLSALGLALVLLATLSGAQRAQPRPPHPATSPRPATPPLPAGPAAAFRSERGYPAVPEPVRLRIPALHVDGRVERLGLQRDGSIAVPERTDVAGWFAGGPRPGQPGPAVLLGHVDSRDGPGIFIDLSRARPGTTVRIDRSDGSTVTFRITRVAKVPKVRFPTDLVYAPTLDPALRLVTCGGSFDRARGSYRDNVIAFAE